jgi:hypothetical protein
MTKQLIESAFPCSKGGNHTFSKITHDYADGINYGYCTKCKLQIDISDGIRKYKPIGE